MAFIFRQSSTAFLRLISPRCAAPVSSRSMASTSAPSSSAAAAKSKTENLPAEVDQDESEPKPPADYEDAPTPPPKKYCSDGVVGLMEFFDERDKWGANEIRVGRSWRRPELRLKSNVDLHKLWYVLLKEKNMLQTMEMECNAEARTFPNPERIDKVEESMKNVEEVIRERNRAYFELETGTSGEQPAKWALSWIGLPTFYKKQEHLVPRQLNPEYIKRSWFRTRLDDGFRQTNRDVRHFLALLKEKAVRKEAYWRRIEYKCAIEVLKAFPNTDLDALQREFPLISVEKLVKSSQMRDLKMWQELDKQKRASGA